MKFIVAVAAALAFACAASPAAKATTCYDLVDNCVVKGGTKAQCSKNLSYCLRTCTMIGGYTGRSFQADEGCGRKKRK